MFVDKDFHIMRCFSTVYIYNDLNIYYIYG